jgi:hypothetical protein
MARKILAACAGLALVFALGAGIASAGLMDTGTPLFDGTTTWSGSTPFQSDSEPLSGVVDWRVYAPGDFPFTGYTPTLGEYTYVYQLRNDPTSVNLSAFTVDVENQADNIAWFQDLTHGVTGVHPTETLLEYENGSSQQAFWRFGEPDKDSITPGATSLGLVFSSSKLPMDSYSGVFDNGTTTIAVPVPSPSSSPAPEPGTVSLIVAGLVFLAGARFGSRRARA